MHSTEEAVAWIEAADRCQQTELRLACVTRLVQRLVGTDAAEHSLAASIADATQLQQCDKSTLLLLLGMVTDAARQDRRDPYVAPKTSEVSKAVRQSANPGSYEWRLSRFTQRPVQPGVAAPSGWFMAGGREWQLILYPNGVDQECEGHLSGECSWPTNVLCHRAWFAEWRGSIARLGLNRTPTTQCTPSHLLLHMQSSWLASSPVHTLPLASRSGIKPRSSRSTGLTSLKA